MSSGSRLSPQQTFCSGDAAWTAGPRTIPTDTLVSPSSPVLTRRHRCPVLVGLSPLGPHATLAGRVPDHAEGAASASTSQAKAPALRLVAVHLATRRPLAPQALETLVAAAVPCGCGMSEPGPWHPVDLGSNPSSVSYPEPRLPCSGLTLFAFEWRHRDPPGRVTTQIRVNGVKGLTSRRCPRSTHFLFSHGRVAQKGYVPRIPRNSSPS